MTSFLARPINWQQAKQANGMLYEAAVDGHQLFIRLNDFPDEELFSIIEEGIELVRFDDWPTGWTRPKLKSV